MNPPRYPDPPTRGVTNRQIERAIIDSLYIYSDREPAAEFTSARLT